MPDRSAGRTAGGPLPLPAGREGPRHAAPQLPGAPTARAVRLATAAFLGGVGLLLALAVIVAALGSSAAEHQERVSAARQARNALDRLVLVVTDAQTGQRGYLIANEPAFLEPYHRALERLAAAQAVVTERLAAAGVRPARAAALDDLVARARQALSQPLELAQRAGLETARAYVAVGEGEQAMQRLRDWTETVRGELELAMALDADMAAREQRLLIAAVAAFLLAALALSAIEYVTFRREIRARHRTEAELRRNGEEIALLSAMADALHAAGDRSESYGVIERFSGALLPEVRGALYVYNNSRDHLARMAAWSRDGTAAASLAQFPPDGCWALRRGKPHRSGPGLPDPPCPHVTDPGGHSLCLPISARGETSSVLHVETGGGDGAALAGAERAALALSDQLALALANVELQEKLRAQAIRDPLTGLHNRRFLEEMLPRELQRAERNGQAVGVLMLDIDHFKRFNDSYGHGAGDSVLALTARVIESALRESDLVCRYGGEEIVVVLPEVGLDAAYQVAEKVRLAVRARDISAIAPGAAGVTVSIGVAAFPACGTAGRDLLQAADAAMYAAKRDGRDRTAVAPRSPSG